jgi:hypothetical protein
LEAAYHVLPLRGEPPMTRFLAQQLSGSHFYSIQRAQNDFGYRSIVSVDEGMRRLEREMAVVWNQPADAGCSPSM